MDYILTIDDRISDGFYFAQGLQVFQELYPPPADSSTFNRRQSWRMWTDPPIRINMMLKPRLVMPLRHPEAGFSSQRIYLISTFRAGILDLLLDLLGFFLADAFLDLGRNTFDKSLGLGQTEPGDGADFLDDLDLLARRNRS